MTVEFREGIARLLISIHANLDEYSAKIVSRCPRTSIKPILVSSSMNNQVAIWLASAHFSSPHLEDLQLLHDDCDQRPTDSILVGHIKRYSGCVWRTNSPCDEEWKP